MTEKLICHTGFKTIASHENRVNKVFADLSSKRKKERKKEGKDTMGESEIRGD